MRKYKYKVIKKNTRVSAAILSECKYFRKYLPNTNVYAIEGTLGIFVFDRKCDAEEWEHYKSSKGRLMIIRVAPIGRGFRPKILSRFLSEIALNEFYNLENGKIISPPKKIISPPKGTICYPGVSVID
jgi:hypothetical protein